MTVSGPGTFAGTTNVQGGTLLVNNTWASASVPVSLGATLGGIGALTGAVAVSGTIAPGASIESLGTGNLSIGASGTLDIELGRSGLTPTADRVDVTGTVTLDIAGGASLKLTKYTGLANPVTGDVFYLIANDDVDSVTGVFTELDGVATTLNEGSTFTWNGQDWQITYAANYDSAVPANSSFTGGNDVAIQALTSVPEPASIGMLGLVGVGILARRRRR